MDCVKASLIFLVLAILSLRSSQAQTNVSRAEAEASDATSQQKETATAAKRSPTSQENASSINPRGNAETDYPGRITIYGAKNISERISDCFGRYSIMPGVSNRGRPVWKHDSRDNRLFFLGTANYWYFGRNWDPKVGIDENKAQ